MFFIEIYSGISAGEEGERRGGVFPDDVGGDLGSRIHL